MWTQFDPDKLDPNQIDPDQAYDVESTLKRRISVVCLLGKGWTKNHGDNVSVLITAAADDIFVYLFFRENRASKWFKLNSISYFL